MTGVEWATLIMWGVLGWAVFRNARGVVNAHDAFRELYSEIALGPLPEKPTPPEAHSPEANACLTRREWLETGVNSQLAVLVKRIDALDRDGGDSYERVTAAWEEITKLKQRAEAATQERNKFHSTLRERHDELQETLLDRLDAMQVALVRHAQMGDDLDVAFNKARSRA